MKVCEIVARFLRWCEPRRAASTIRQYRSRLRKLVRALGDEVFDDLRPLDLQEFLDDINLGMAPDTQRANIILLERLQTWAVEYQLLDVPVLTRIEKPRGRRRERIPTAAEISQIMDATDRPFQLIYTALRYSGARPNELCRSRVSDIDVESNCIVLHNHKTAAKTGRPRIIPIGSKLQLIVDESLGGRTEGHLFLRGNGKPWTTDSLGAKFRRIRERLGLPRDLVLYLARHEFATRVVKARGIYEAGQALSHSDIKTTQRYAHLDLDDIRRAQEAAFEDDLA